MKITITTTDQPAWTLFQYREETRKLINAKVKTDFARWEGSKLLFRGCANKELHNKMFILCAIFTDSFNGETYTDFGDMSLNGYKSLAEIIPFYEFVKEIDLKNTIFSRE